MSISRRSMILVSLFAVGLGFCFSAASQVIAAPEKDAAKPRILVPDDDGWVPARRGH